MHTCIRMSLVPGWSRARVWVYPGYCMQIRQMNFLRLTTARTSWWLLEWLPGCWAHDQSKKKKTEILALAAEHDFFIDDILLENVDKFSRAVVSFTQIRTCTPSSIPFWGHGLIRVAKLNERTRGSQETERRSVTTTELPARIGKGELEKRGLRNKHFIQTKDRVYGACVECFTWWRRLLDQEQRTWKPNQHTTHRIAQYYSWRLLERKDDQCGTAF